ncbi:MAG: hypothetical protein GXY44_01280 [Phycisphaerales bacterium]|nr:hypothetical protein [Phycisphaerales bacterium]
MKRWLWLLWLIIGSMVLSVGCGDGVAYTRREREQRWRQYFQDDMEQLNDDFDLFMLNDRPSRLSRWK